MSSSIVLGIRLTLNSLERVKIDKVDLESKVEWLRKEVSRKTNVPKEQFVLVYCGHILQDDLTLRACGVSPGCTVHVLKRREKEPAPVVRNLGEADIQQLVIAFQSLILTPGFRGALQRLCRPEVLENIIAATPGLADDPVAVAMLHDPELLVHMADVSTARRIAEAHPSLAEAANQIAAAVHEDAGSSGSQQMSSGYSYSLDALSDEDEMDSSQSSDTQNTPSQSGGPGGSTDSLGVFPTITAAQLAAALASATGAGPSGSNNGNSSQNFITPEMFSHAVEQAVASIADPSGSRTQPGDTSSSSMSETAEEDYSSQLCQMREMGLPDNALNLHALRATSGDVQAALDLVFSGWLPDQSSSTPPP